MTKTRWIGVAAAAVAIVVALAAGMWFGGGPTSREGWEAAAWAGTIVTALALIANAIVWTSTSTKPSSIETPDAPVGTNIAVKGNVSGRTVVQGGDVYVEDPSYGGNHNDFRGGTFNGPVIGEQHNHRSGSEENTGPDR